MEPVKEEIYRKQIRNALMESYEPPKPQLEAQPCGTLNKEVFTGKMIEIMEAYRLQDPPDWARFYDKTHAALAGITFVPVDNPPTEAFCFKTINCGKGEK